MFPGVIEDAGHANLLGDETATHGLFLFPFP
jgi:hypothetical protein